MTSTSIIVENVCNYLHINYFLHGNHCRAFQTLSNWLLVCVSISELQENTEALKTKMSELRLYCDLLLQQVNKIKDNDELGDTAEVRLRFG